MNEWISVEDRPGPTDARMVFVWGTTDEGRRFVSVGVYHSPGDWEMVSDASEGANYDGYFEHYGMTIRGWMPLPEPPK